MPVTAGDKEFELLGKLVPLNTLSESALTALLGKVEIERARKGEVLFSEGDVEHVNLYLLVGKIGLYNGDTLADSLDDSSATARFPVAHQLPRKFTAKALSKIEYIRIDSRVLSDALADKEADDYQVEDIEEGDNDWMSQLLQSRVMQNIPAANLQGVMMRMQEMPVKKGDLIIKEGDEGDFYYLLNKGQVAVLKRDENGVDTELTRLGAGASFGEDALLSDSPRSSTVQMLTDGVLLRLSKDDFIELIKHPLSESVTYEEGLKLVEGGAVWLDVRDPEAFEQDHLPGAINMPYKTLRFQIPSLATDRQYIVYSKTGKRGLASAFLFLESGLQVSTLEGGFAAVSKDAAAEPLEPAEETPVVDEQPADEPLETPAGQTAPASEPLANEERDVLKAEIESLREQLVQAQTVQAAVGSGSDAELQEKLNKLLAENEKLLKQSQRLEREKIGLSEQLESEEEVYDKLKQQYDSLSDENKKHLQLRDADMAKLKEKLTVLQLERDQFESELEELQQSTGQAADQASEADDVDTQQVNRISELEALNASIVAERDALNTQLEELRNKLSLATQENSELQIELAYVKDQLAEIQASNG
ncbi:MAG: cyclic nucleotide-binding domain-containing protein [Chromatiales bacterium]|jgi:CRP-like cAMP-binding protein/rhodanese-related sulfurtransferase